MSERKRAPKSATWEDRLSADVGLNIAVAREDAGMTAQELSDVLTAGGVRLGRPAISQIENGQRAVSLAEALAIAAVLGVAPADLIFDPSPDPVEALPGETRMTGAEAADWVRGDLSVPEDGQSRADWLADAAEAKAAPSLVNRWSLLSRVERQLFMHHRGVERAQARLLGAADAIDRLNAQQSLDAATAAAIQAAKSFDLITGATAASEGARPDAGAEPETLELVARYKTMEMPSLGIAPSALSQAWANRTERADQN
jgi:transcriptional regulator with XRE-family HTH domain